MEWQNSVVTVHLLFRSQHVSPCVARAQSMLSQAKDANVTLTVLVSRGVVIGGE
jgi:hypothetical protein